MVVLNGAGTSGLFVDRYSMNNCPATSITAANTIASIALASWGTSFMALNPGT